jgi:hypothetical protein
MVKRHILVGFISLWWLVYVGLKSMNVINLLIIKDINQLRCLLLICWFVSVDGYIINYYDVSLKSHYIHEIYPLLSHCIYPIMSRCYFLLLIKTLPS